MTDHSIPESVKGALGLFELVDSFSHATSDISQQSAAHDISEEKSRFKVWSGNIGAHKSGRRSLQYRLRDASHLQKQVLSLLADLSKALQDAIAILSGEKIPWDKLEGADDFGEDEEGDEGSNDNLPSSELGQISADVNDVISCLLRLSVAIRNPTPHDYFATSKATDKSHYEPFDIQHVRSKYKDASNVIAERLGKAITSRRQYFKYRESHHAKLSHGLNPDDDSIEDTMSTLASSLPAHLKSADGIHASSIPKPLDEDAVSDSGVSQTSFASSTADVEKLRVPPLPKIAEKGPFECPFCYMMISVTTTIAWRRHVYGDLHPYICLSEDCAATNKEFSRRHEWIAHEVENHWKIFNCPCSCGDSFLSASSCRKHLDNFHHGEIPETQIDAMIALGSRPRVAEDIILCPLCQDQLSSFKQYQQHVGRHQEQLALFALPYAEQSEVGDYVTDDSSLSSQVKEHSEMASKERIEANKTPANMGDLEEAKNEPTSTSPRETLAADDITAAVVQSASVDPEPRISAACTECQRRKQKCNRVWPCNHCQERNVVDECVFHTVTGPPEDFSEDVPDTALRTGASEFISAALAESAGGDSVLRSLVKRVVVGQADQHERDRFENIVNQLSTKYEGRRAQQSASTDLSWFGDSAANLIEDSPWNKLDAEEEPVDGPKKRTSSPLRESGKSRASPSPSTPGEHYPTSYTGKQMALDLSDIISTAHTAKALEGAQEIVRAQTNQKHEIFENDLASATAPDESTDHDTTSPALNQALGACINCRDSKIRCNRGRPCSACARLGLNCVQTPQPREDYFSGEEGRLAGPGSYGGIVGQSQGPQSATTVPEVEIITTSDLIEADKVASPNTVIQSRQDNLVLSHVAIDQYGKAIPPDAPWSEISRRLVSAEALELSGYRYEVRPRYVAILGALTHEQVKDLINTSQELRSRRLSQQDLNAEPSTDNPE